MLHQLLIQVSRVCSSSHEARLFMAAFTLAFYGTFRLGELVSPSKRAGEVFLRVTFIVRILRWRYSCDYLRQTSCERVSMFMYTRSIWLWFVQ